MNIGINCCHLSDQNDGAKKRIINIYTNIIKKKKEWNFFFFISKNLNIKKIDKRIKKKNVFFIKINVFSYQNLKRFFLNFYFWKKILKKYNIHYFDQSYLPLFFLKNTNTKILLTIHDLRYSKKDLDNNIFKKFIHKCFLKISIYLSTEVIVVSNSIKKKLYNFNKKINVIPNFVNIKIKKNNYKNKKIKKYLLYVGHLEFRKNILNLIFAFNYLKNNFFYDGKLLLCFNKFDDLKKIENTIKKFNLSKDIILKKNLNDNQIYKYYSNAQVFIFPSFYEGFGIPILESCLFKTPFVLSNIEVFKEITLYKGIYFNPYDYKDMAIKINNVLNNKELKKRLILLSGKILKKYNINKITSDYLKLFN